MPFGARRPCCSGVVRSLRSVRDRRRWRFGRSQCKPPSRERPRDPAGPCRAWRQTAVRRLSDVGVPAVDIDGRRTIHQPAPGVRRGIAVASNRSGVQHDPASRMRVSSPPLRQRFVETARPGGRPCSTAPSSPIWTVPAPPQEIQRFVDHRCRESGGGSVPPDENTSG